MNDRNIMNISLTGQVLDEPGVLALMTAELTRQRVEAERLWQVLKGAEADKAPYQEAYDQALVEWNEAQRLAESLAACLKAKEDRP